MRLSSIWLLTGPFLHFSDTWQLVINTGTTVVTFLMVFLIQRSQNKDALAVQLKLDEIVAALEGARELRAHGLADAARGLAIEALDSLPTLPVSSPSTEWARFIATTRSSSWSVARQTVPIPPAPICSSSR